MGFYIEISINGDTESQCGFFRGDLMAFQVFKKQEDLIKIKCWHDEGYGRFNCRVRVALYSKQCLKAVTNCYSKFKRPTKVFLKERRRFNTPPAQIKYLKKHPPIYEAYLEGREEKELSISLKNGGQFTKYDDDSLFIVIVETFSEQ